MLYNTLIKKIWGNSITNYINNKLETYRIKFFFQKKLNTKHNSTLFIKDFFSWIPSSLIYSNIYAIAIVDIDGFYIYSNEVFQKNFISQKEMDKADFIKKNYQENNYEYIEAIKYCIQNPNKIKNLKLQKSNNYNDLNFYLTHWEFIAIKNIHHQVIGVMCIGHDITSIKELQKKLDDSESRLKAILDNTKDSYLLISPDYKILAFNKVAKEYIQLFFNRNIEEGDNCWLYVAREMKKDFDYYFNLALQGKASIKETEISTSKNQSIWFLISFYPVYNQENEIIGVSYNTTNINSVKEKNILLEKQNESLLEIARIQSHEVRKPVANILGLISLINKDDLSPTNIKLLTYLEKSTLELDKIIHKIVIKTKCIM